MTDDRPTLTTAEARARDAVRALGVPQADPAFRARLAREFATGTLGAPPRRIVALPWFQRPAVRWGLAPLAAAAAVLLVSALNRGPEWKVSGELGGEGVAVVDGRPIPLSSGHLGDLARAIRPGARVQMPDGVSLDLVSPGLLAVRLMDGADMTVPSPPGRWFGRRVNAEVQKGELRISTGAAFHGAVLHIATLSAELEVRGTTLAVICEPEGTCVCVEEGVVMVGEKEGPMVPVPHGMRRYIYNDDRAPVLAPMRPQEHEALPKFEAEHGTALRKSETGQATR
jgi:hypothetical protein